MSDGSLAIALLNLESTTVKMSISPWRDSTVLWGNYTVRHVWAHQETGPFDMPFTTEWFLESWV
jgi:alpha-galactosidase